MSQRQQRLQKKRGNSIFAVTLHCQLLLHLSIEGIKSGQSMSGAHLGLFHVILHPLRLLSVCVFLLQAACFLAWLVHDHLSGLSLHLKFILALVYCVTI